MILTFQYKSTILSDYFINALCVLWMSFLIHIVARMKLNRTSWYLDVTHLQSSERSMNRLIFIANPSWKFTKIMLSSDNFYLCTTKPRCLLRGQIRPFTGFMYHMFNVHIRSLWSVNPSVLLCPVFLRSERNSQLL